MRIKRLGLGGSSSNVSCGIRPSRDHPDCPSLERGSTSSDGERAKGERMSSLQASACSMQTMTICSTAKLHCDAQTPNESTTSWPLCLQDSIAALPVVFTACAARIARTSEGTEKSPGSSNGCESLPELFDQLVGPVSLLMVVLPETLGTDSLANSRSE